MNVLYVDKPIGTGFSYSNIEELNTNVAGVADDFIYFLERFILIKPMFKLR